MVCDYVHLNPVRARMLDRGERMLGYPWSSLGWYLAAAEHRPRWIRVDRLLGEHGIGADTAAGRAEFERRMEARRCPEMDEAECEPLGRGWCLGSEAFRKQMLERMEGQLGESHAGELRRESAEVRAERIIAEELGRLGWSEAQLREWRKSDAAKLALAARLRRETTLTVGWIANRLHLGTRKSAAVKLHRWSNRKQKVEPD